MSALSELRERLEKAEGPDRELDSDIFIALERPGWVKAKNEPGSIAKDAKSFWPEGKLRFHTATSGTSPHFTASIDAALALVERKLPGWGSERRSPGKAWREKGAKARCLLSKANGIIRCMGIANTEPLAILAALLKALEQEDRT